jgi:hypothetical protein
MSTALRRFLGITPWCPWEDPKYAGKKASPTVEAAADLVWAAANAASLLHVTAQLRKTAPPTSAVLEQIRENAMRSILNSETKARSQ